MEGEEKEKRIRRRVKKELVPPSDIRKITALVFRRLGRKELNTRVLAKVISKTIGKKCSRARIDRVFEKSDSFVVTGDRIRRLTREEKVWRERAKGTESERGRGGSGTRASMSFDEYWKTIRVEPVSWIKMTNKESTQYHRRQRRICGIKEDPKVGIQVTDLKEREVSGGKGGSRSLTDELVEEYMMILRAKKSEEEES